MDESTYSGAMDRRLASIALAGFAALAAAMGVGRFAFTPILPMMQGEGALDVAQGGWLASANYVGYLVGGLTAARLPTHPRGAIRAGLLAVGISTLAMGLADRMWVWLALRAIAGVASAWVLVFASSWCLEQFHLNAPSERRAWLGATVFAGVGTGIALAGAACLLLLVAKVSAAGAWIALGVISLAVAAALWNRFAGEPGTAPADKPAANGWSGEAWRMIVCYGAFGFGYIIPATFLAAMARDAIPDPAIYGWSWPAFGAAAALSTFAAAALRRNLSERALWIAGHAVMAVGVAIPLAVHGLAGIVASALLVGATFMVVTMAGIQEARRVAGPRARALIAAMTSSFAAGQIAGPLLVSFLAARGLGFTPALITASAALAASALALVFHPKRQREIFTRP
jgi:predicted MFS family arabinose efflux permease